MDKTTAYKTMDIFRNNLDKAMDLIKDEKIMLMVNDLLEAAEFATDLEIQGPTTDYFIARKTFRSLCRFPDMIDRSAWRYGEQEQ